MSLRDKITQQSQLVFTYEVDHWKAVFSNSNHRVPFRAYATITNSYTSQKTQYDIFQCTTEKHIRDRDYGDSYEISNHDVHYRTEKVC